MNQHRVHFTLRCHVPSQRQYFFGFGRKCVTTHVADIGRSREQQRWTKRNRERPTGRHVEESGREWQRTADWKTCGRERQRVGENGISEDMWKRAADSGRKRPAAARCGCCGAVRLLRRAALAKPCGLLRRYWARRQEASRRPPRGIPEAYQRHTRGKPRGKPQRQTLLHEKIYMFWPERMQR